MTLLPAVEIVTGPDPQTSIIWLHGLGADGNDFAPIVPEIAFTRELPTRFIFPHAPPMPVTVNNGFVMPAWYDILEMDIDRMVDIPGLMNSAQAIRLFIDGEIERGIDSKRIIIAGFSQGGAVAYQVALSHEKELGGLLVMSSYFATEEIIQYSEINRQIPIKIQHGQFDMVVPEILGQQAAEKLKRDGYSISYQTYPMEHAVCPEQLDDISSWLELILS